MTKGALVDAKPTMAMAVVTRAASIGLAFMRLPWEEVFGFRALPLGPRAAADASSVGEPAAT
jgi:hypothetical protein